MEILYLLLPIAVIVSIIIAAFFLWTVKTGQYEDLDGEGHRILMDDDEVKSTVSSEAEQ